MNRNRSGAVKWLVRWLAWLFLVLGALKLLAVSGETTLMTKQSPVFNFISYRQTLLLGALLEIGAGFYGLLSVSQLQALAAISWVTSLLVFYRLASVWIGVGVPCSCLGPAAAWFGWTPPFERIVTASLLVVIALTCLIGWILTFYRRSEVL
jgi:hypothetical protein